MLRKHQGKKVQVMAAGRQAQRWEPLRPLPHTKDQPAYVRNSTGIHTALAISLTDLALGGELQSNIVCHRTNDLDPAAPLLLLLQTKLPLGDDIQSSPVRHDKNDSVSASVVLPKFTELALEPPSSSPFSSPSSPSSCSSPSTPSSSPSCFDSLPPSPEGPSAKPQPHLSPFTPPDQSLTNIHTKTPTPPTPNSMSVNGNTTPQKIPPATNMGSTTPIQQSSFYEVRSTANKGQGMYAIKDIPAGTLLIEEAPLFAVPAGPGMSQLIIRSFVDMPLTEKEAWMTLSARDKAQESGGAARESEKDTDGTASAANSISSMSSLAGKQGAEGPHAAPSSEPCAGNGCKDDDEKASLSVEQNSSNEMDKLAALLINDDDKTEHGTHDKKTHRPVYHYQDFKPFYDEAAARRLEGERERQVERYARSLCNVDDCAVHRLKRNAHVRKDSAVGNVVPNHVGSENVATTGEDKPSENMVGKGTPTDGHPIRSIAGEDTIERNIPKETPIQPKPFQPTLFNTKRALNIFETNALGCEVGNKIVAALCLNAARMNHSCTPNVFCAYNTESETHTVHAVKTIAAGEEICSSYIAGTCLTGAERKAELEKWGFECTCPACGGEIDGSNERRLQLYALRQTADMTRERFQRGQLSPEAAARGAAVVLQMVKLMEEEGLAGGEMVDLCGAIGMLNLQAGRANLALPWLWRKVELVRRCYGNRSPIFCREMASFEGLYNRLCGIAR